MVEKRFVYFTLLLLLFSLPMKSQTDEEVKQYYSVFDSIIGAENIHLYNGLRYFQAYNTSIDNHPYYKYLEFQKGDVIYNEQPYYGIDLRYDVFQDILITKLLDNKSFFDMQFTSVKVTSFDLDGRHFVYLKDNLSNLVPGFYELSFSNNLNFYIRHYKTKKDIIKDSRLNSVFSYKKDFWLSYNDQYHHISSKKDLLRAFPNQKAYINTYFKKYKKQFQMNSEKFMLNLISKLDENIYNK